jgi:hypothetical protein
MSGSLGTTLGEFLNAKYRYCSTYPKIIIQSEVADSDIAPLEFLLLFTWSLLTHFPSSSNSPGSDLQAVP